jgi:hypothetical protein
MLKYGDYTMHCGTGCSGPTPRARTLLLMHTPMTRKKPVRHGTAHALHRAGVPYHQTPDIQ